MLLFYLLAHIILQMAFEELLWLSRGSSGNASYRVSAMLTGAGSLVGSLGFWFNSPRIPHLIRSELTIQSRSKCNCSIFQRKLNFPWLLFVQRIQKALFLLRYCLLHHCLIYITMPGELIQCMYFSEAMDYKLLAKTVLLKCPKSTQQKFLHDWYAKNHKHIFLWIISNIIHFQDQYRLENLIASSGKYQLIG